MEKTRGSVSIDNASLIVGDLSKQTMKLVKEWILLHKKELLEMWETQTFKKLKGLD